MCVYNFSSLIDTPIETYYDTLGHTLPYYTSAIILKYGSEYAHSIDSNENSLGIRYQNKI